MKKNILYLSCLFIMALGAKERKTDYTTQGLILIVPIYEETISEPNTQFLELLKENLKNPYIKKIHALYQENVIVESNLHQKRVPDQEITFSSIKKEPTFSRLYKLAHTLYPNEKIIISGPNTVFNDTLGKLAYYKLRKTFIALKHWNLNNLEIPPSNVKNNFQESWIFQTPLSIEEKTSHTKKKFNQKVSLYQRLRSSDLHLINPSYSLITNQKNKTETRNWQQSEKKSLFNLKPYCLP